MVPAANFTAPIGAIDVASHDRVGAVCACTVSRRVKSCEVWSLVVYGATATTRAPSVASALARAALTLATTPLYSVALASLRAPLAAFWKSTLAPRPLPVVSFTRLVSTAA